VALGIGEMHVDDLFWRRNFFFALASVIEFRFFHWEGARGRDSRFRETLLILEVLEANEKEKRRKSGKKKIIVAFTSSHGMLLAATLFILYCANMLQFIPT
jgi:hypothetical protein